MPKCSLCGKVGEYVCKPVAEEIATLAQLLVRDAKLPAETGTAYEPDEELVEYEYDFLDDEFEDEEFDS